MKGRSDAAFVFWVGFGFFFGDSVRLFLRTSLPGLAPAGHLLSLLRQRKKAKKGDPQSSPFGCPKGRGLKREAK